MNNSDQESNANTAEPIGNVLSLDRGEFLSWVKYRAIKEMEYCDDPASAVSSFFSDLQKYSGPEPIYNNEQLKTLIVMASLNCNSVAQMRRWVEGCN